jgi:hypothetical protein
VETYPNPYRNQLQHGVTGPVPALAGRRQRDTGEISGEISGMILP